MKYAAMVIAGALLGAAPALADEAPAGPADLVLEAVGAEQRQQCSQFAMNLSAEAAKVRPLVPRTFVFSRDAAGKAVLGYRMFECRGMRIGSAPPRRVVWSELGVRSLPPEGLPAVHIDQHVDGHDYYMLAFRTSSPRLARALRALGLELPGQPGLLAARLGYRAERVPLPIDPGDATVRDVLAPVDLAARENVPGGSYETSVSSTGGLWYQKNTNPLDVREWFIREDCRVISVFEHKLRPTAMIPTIDLTVAPGTLIDRLIEKTADPDGYKRVTSSTDVYVQFDEQMSWTVRDMPVALVPAAYEAVREHSSAADGTECRA